MTTPLDTSIEAEYTDGFILSETEQGDISLYQEGKNTFYDVLEKHPEGTHGPLKRFSVYYKNMRYDYDWTQLPENARPIRFRHGVAYMNTATGEQGMYWSGLRFGYQYNDETGKNHQIVQEL